MEFKTSLILVYILNSVIFYNTYILATDSFTGCYSKQIKDFGGCLTEESSMWTFQSISSRQCAAFCIRDTVCVSFFYKQNIGCLGFDNVLSSVSKNLSTSGWRYYVTCKAVSTTTQSTSVPSSTVIPTTVTPMKTTLTTTSVPSTPPTSTTSTTSTNGVTSVTSTSTTASSTAAPVVKTEAPAMPNLAVAPIGK